MSQTATTCIDEGETNTADAPTFCHSVLKIQCDVASTTLKRNSIKIRTKETYQETLSFLLSKIAKKFESIAQMNKSDWSLTINGQTVDKQNPDQFAAVLCSVPPIAVVRIIPKVCVVCSLMMFSLLFNYNKITTLLTAVVCSATQGEQTICGKDGPKFSVIVHHEHKKFDFQLTQWKVETFENLITAITNEFDIRSSFELFEHVDGEEVDIEDIDDIKDSFEDYDAAPHNNQVLHLFVRVPKQVLISYKQDSFSWVLPQIDDEKEKEMVCNSLMEKIAERFNLPRDDIKLVTNEAGVDCIMDVLQLFDDGEGIKSLFQLRVSTETPEVIIEDPDTTSNSSQVM